MAFSFQSPLLIYRRGRNGLRILYLVEKDYYPLLNKLTRTSSIRVVHAGVYLGVLGSEDFTPSLQLGSALVRKRVARSNMVWINEHASELYTYGRDVFGCSITKRSSGVFKENTWVLVLDELGEFLGWGKLMVSLESMKGPCEKPVIKNMLDIGMYLRCEESVCTPPEI